MIFPPHQKREMTFALSDGAGYVKFDPVNDLQALKIVKGQTKISLKNGLCYTLESKTSYDYLLQFVKGN